MKKLNKKLALNKESVMNLNEMIGIHGGVGGKSGAYTEALTCFPCAQHSDCFCTNPKVCIPASGKVACVAVKNDTMVYPKG